MPSLAFAQSGGVPVGAGSCIPQGKVVGAVNAGSPPTCVAGGGGGGGGGFPLTGTVQGAGNTINQANLTAACVNGVCDVSAFGASGLDTTATCDATASSNQLTNCSGTLLSDIKVGNYIEVAGAAGYASPLTNLTTFTATVQGGDTSGPSYTYAVCTVDPWRGVAGSCAQQTVTNGPAILKIPTDIAIAFTNPNSGVNSAIYTVYRKIGAGAWQYLQTLNGGAMVDIGAAPSSSHGWPATPPVGPARQYFWSKVTASGGGTITLQDTVQASVSAATIKHDDTIPFQQAINSAVVATGHKVTASNGTFNIDEPSAWDLFAAAPFPQYYRFDAGLGVATNHLFGLGMLVIPGTVNLAFSGRNITILKTSFEGNPSGQNAGFGMDTGNFQNPFFLDPAPTAYGLNNGSAGDTYVTTTTAANAGNFSPGDNVIVAGGGFVPTPYVPNSIRLVLSVDVTTGRIILDEPLVKPLPMGTPGTAPEIFKITGQVVQNVELSDMTVENYTSLFTNTSAVDHLHLAHVDFPWGWNTDLGHTFFMRDWTMDDCHVQSAQNEFDLEDDTRFSYGTWTTVGGAIFANEGTANFQFDHSNIFLSQQMCVGNVPCDTNSSAQIGTARDTYNTRIENNNITGTHNEGDAGNTSVVAYQGNPLTGYTPSIFKLRNNVIKSPASKIMVLGQVPIYDLEITGNTITHNSPAGAIETIGAAGGLIEGNDIIVNGVGSLGNAVLLLSPSLTIPLPFQIMNNHIKIATAQSYIGVYINDPGSAFVPGIVVEGNSFENLTTGVDFISSANTPNYSIPIGTNTFNTVANNYLPAAIANFTASPATQGVGYSIATNTGSYTGSSNGNGFWRWNFTSGASGDGLFTNNIATLSYNLITPPTTDDATQPEVAHTFNSYFNGFAFENISMRAANGTFAGSPWSWDAKYDGTNTFQTIGGSSYASGSAGAITTGGTTPNAAILTLNGGSATNFGGKGYIEVTPSSGISTVPILEANGDTSLKRAGLGVFRVVNGIGGTPVALATLPACASGFEGVYGTQTDSTAACSAGATATAAGTTHCAIYCNGTNWKQLGF